MSDGISHDQAIDDLLNRLVQTSNDHAVFLLNPDATVRWCNATALRLFALDSDIVGQPSDVLFTPEDRAVGIPQLETEIATRAPTSIDDRWHLRGDGTRFWASGVLVKITDPVTEELLGFGKIVRDRTDVKTQLDLLVHQRDALDADNQTKDRAITSLAHELRNVIAGMRGSLELLNRPLDDQEMRTKFFGLMQRQLGMIERLVEDVLDVKRGERGAIVLNCEPVVLQQELRICIDRFEQRLQKEGITLELIAPAPDIMIRGDRVRLQQIYGNLLDNAIKFTPAGGTIWVKLTIEDQLAVVHVQDTGRGIPHEMLEGIFNLFTQVDTKSSSGGLGVGLALVRELTVLHGGSVQAESHGIGSGSEFTVRLPTTQVAAST